MVQLEKVYTKEDPKFLPPYGDGTASYEKLVTLFKFSPPYGDGTVCCERCSKAGEFSPPYGDGTIYWDTDSCKFEFSPPYGDGALNISQKIVKWKSRMPESYSLY